MGLHEGVQPNTFYQISIQENHRGKIKHTVTRLRESGREPTSLEYVTAQTIKMLDRDEISLTQETGVFVRIRDANWIIANINHSNATVAAFVHFLKPYLAFLGNVGAATIIEHPKPPDLRAVCVFLGQEVERRRSRSKLIESVSDSLILWSLEGTDPDQGIFATRAEIMQRIEEVLPAAKHFIRGVLDNRLRLLSSKNNTTGREIRWYKKANQFCLPYETRQLVEQENIEDESLKAHVLREFEVYVQNLDEEISPRRIAHIAHRAIELAFQGQGLELAAFLEEGIGYEELSISDRVDEAVQEARVPGEEALVIKEAALAAIRRAFYESTEDQRRYFSKLSRTYSLLFSLRADPRIVEYFQSMSSELILLVGTDILIQALSERYLRTEDQMTCNMLHILKDAGADLILTQPVIEEIHAHLENTDREFQNDFRTTEEYVSIDIARHSPKVLIRAYFRARLQPPQGVEVPRAWRFFIEQICDYALLHEPRGRDQIRKYLCERFGLQFMSAKDIEDLVSGDKVQELAGKLEAIPGEKKRVLAENDAKMILSVYGKRQVIKEEHRANPYGYRTWWLTHETRVRAATRDLVHEQGAQYIMRPEFLLNFIALSPTTEEVRRAHEAVFPTLLGIKLSNRMREDLFHELMRKAKDVTSVDDARVRVMMNEYSDRLKGDFYKQYEVELTSQG